MEGEPIPVEEYLSEFYTLKGKYSRLIESLQERVLAGSDVVISKIFGADKAGRWSENTKVAIFSLLAIGYPMLICMLGLAWIFDRNG